jgi:hypothetical protein
VEAIVTLKGGGALNQVDSSVTWGGHHIPFRVGSKQDNIVRELLLVIIVH